MGLQDAAVEAIAGYLDTLAEWGHRINLTGARTAAERVELLVAPILPLQDIPEAGSLLDVGSGNGSPGLVLGLLRGDLDVTLLEPRTRRWAFLREAARRSGRPTLRAVRGRHDTYPGPPALTVTLRALALPLQALAPLVAPGGRVVVLGCPRRLEGPFEEEECPLADIRVYRRLAGDVPRETPPVP